MSYIFKGVYTFNLTKWENSNSNELKVWCNNTIEREERNYLVGYLKQSNLLMIVLENESKKRECESIQSLIGKRRDKVKKSGSNPSSILTKNLPNRYRSHDSKACYSYFPNESFIFRCNHARSNFLLISYASVINAFFVLFIALMC